MPPDTGSTNTTVRHTTHHTSGDAMHIFGYVHLNASSSPEGKWEDSLSLLLDKTILTMYKAKLTCQYITDVSFCEEEDETFAHVLN